MKLNKFLDVSMPLEVRAIVGECDLISLMNYSLMMLDDQLLTTFVKRCNKDTSSLYRSFGEMPITLDDVSDMFHFPLAGNFFIGLIISQQLACITVVHDLGVTKEQVINEFMTNMCANFCLSWLRDKYGELVHQSMNEVNAKVYMIHLVGFTILTDKFHVYIDAKLYGCLVAFPMSVRHWGVQHWLCYMLHLES